MKNMLGFIKRNSKSAKLFVSCMMISIIASLSAISASAVDETTTDLTSAFSAALADIQSDILTFISIALPVGLAVFGAIIAVKKGISFVRSLLGKS